MTLPLDQLKSSSRIMGVQDFLDMDGVGLGTIEALYVHVPFCRHKCHYCDFYSLATVPETTQARNQQQAFVNQLIEETRYWSARLDLRPRTIFFGGGTPTLLSGALWDQLLHEFAKLGLLHHVEEFTVEANPETVDAPLLTTLVKRGVNRISLGAQSFDKALLHMLQREHEPANVGRAVQLARQAGLNNINLDLIFAIPGQTMDTLERDLHSALSLQPDHLSCYSLIYEPHTPLRQRLEAGQVTALPEELELGMYRRVMQLLESAGYEHYEISNWAKPGKRCTHNMLYWTNANWLGLGPAAASHVSGRRWKNRPNLSLYLGESVPPPIADPERLDPDARLGETLMLRLRLREGVALDWLEPRLLNDERRRNSVEGLIRMEMLEQTPTHLRLSAKGLPVADAVIAQLL